MPNGKSKTSSRSIEDTKQYHEDYLRAVSNFLGKKALRALKEDEGTIEDLESRTGLNRENLEWHPSILEYGFCVEKGNEQGKVTYRFTQEGKVVDHIE